MKILTKKEALIELNKGNKIELNNTIFEAIGVFKKEIVDNTGFYYNNWFNFYAPSFGYKLIKKKKYND